MRAIDGYSCCWVIKEEIKMRKNKKANTAVQ